MSDKQITPVEALNLIMGVAEELTADGLDPYKALSRIKRYANQGLQAAYRPPAVKGAEDIDNNFQSLEWPSQSPTAAGDGKEDAVKFSEWLIRSYFEEYRDKKELKWGTGHGRLYTTAQLYDIFKNRNNEQK